MTKVIIVIVVFFGFLGCLVYIAKRNEKLKNEKERLEEAKKRQSEVTKVYEKKQKEANDVGKAKGGKVVGGVDAGNKLVDSFNRMQDDSKR